MNTIMKCDTCHVKINVFEEVGIFRRFYTSDVLVKVRWVCSEQGIICQLYLPHLQIMFLFI